MSPNHGNLIVNALQDACLTQTIGYINIQAVNLKTSSLAHYHLPSDEFDIDRASIATILCQRLLYGKHN